MPSLTLPYAALGAAAHPGLFGGNVLAPRAHMTGEASYAEAIEELGVTTLRYPGGSLTETMFDLRNPDATTAEDPDTGEIESFIPLSEVMAYAEDTGRAVTIVIPTRDQLSDTDLDDNGDRLPAIDREVLQQFVRDLVTGEYGDAKVAALEIGNEYWGSGEMNAAEYGRLAADMVQIIDRELQSLEGAYPEAVDIDLLVQVGTNFGYSDLEPDYEGLSEQEIIADLNATYDLSLDEGVIFPNGGIDWTEVNNEILLGRFDEEALDPVDGVISHTYSRAPDVPHSRWFQLEQIEEIWQERDPSLEIHVTEWNQKSNTEVFEDDADYGLYQAQEMLEMVEEFMRMDVQAAQVWPLIQNTASTLATGREFDGPTAPGEMFSLMSHNLPDMRMLDFTAETGNRDTEFETPEMDVHGFADGEDMLFFFTSNSRDAVVDSEVDISGLVAGFGSIEITTLGVANGAAPGDTESRAVVENPDPEDLYADGVIETILAPGEIMMVRLNDVQPTEDFAEVFAATATVPEEESLVAGVSETGTTGAEDDPGLVTESEEEEAAALDDAEEDDGGDDMGLGWALALLPLLFFLG
jgi:hypothetical protein